MPAKGASGPTLGCGREQTMEHIFRSSPHPDGGESPSAQPALIAVDPGHHTEPDGLGPSSSASGSATDPPMPGSQEAEFSSALRRASAARRRCEIVFFSSLDISAKVWAPPAGTKMVS